MKIKFLSVLAAMAPIVIATEVQAQKQPQWSASTSNQGVPSWSNPTNNVNSQLQKPQWSGYTNARPNIASPVVSDIQNLNSQLWLSMDSVQLSHGKVNTSPLIAARLDNLATNSLDRIYPSNRYQQQRFISADTTIAQTTDSSGFTGSFEDMSQARRDLLVDPLATVGGGKKGSPGSTFGTPSGYGAAANDGFVGLSGAVSDTGIVDGSAVVGFGLGNPRESIGLETALAIISLKDGFGDRGALGLKAHHSFDNGIAVALGWSNAIRWGLGTQNNSGNVKETVYGVVTKRLELQPENEANKLPLTISAGIGTGSYRSVGAIQANTNTPNFFASLGLRVIPEASVITSWTGNSLNLGTSIAPFKVPVSLTMGLTDITNNNAGTGFQASLGYSFKF
jgi:hypothetical protein